MHCTWIYGTPCNVYTWRMHSAKRCFLLGSLPAFFSHIFYIISTHSSYHVDCKCCWDHLCMYASSSTDVLMLMWWFSCMHAQRTKTHFAFFILPSFFLFVQPSKRRHKHANYFYAMFRLPFLVYLVRMLLGKSFLWTCKYILYFY